MRHSASPKRNDSRLRSASGGSTWCSIPISPSRSSPSSIRSKTTSAGGRARTGHGSTDDTPRQIPMTADRHRLLEVCRYLNESGARYLIAGGHACALHGLVRTTKDVDILIPKDRENAQRVHSALVRLPYKIASEHDPDELVAKPITIIGDDPRVDVLLAAGKMSFEKAWPAHLERTIDGIRVPFLDLDALVSSKDTDRPRDRADLVELRYLQQHRSKPSG